MYSKIMVPVDLAHQDRLKRSLDCAADLARHWGSSVTYVGITASAPGSVAHNPQEYEARLADFASAQAAAHGITADHLSMVSHDPSIDLDKTLLKAAEDCGADLVVMESHSPNITDYVWPSHGGHLASHAGCSVMLVRG